MQFRVSDDAAIDFADKFYAAIVRGDGVERAVSDGRRAMITQQEWATPVLFLRGSGDLFRREPVAAVGSPASQAGVESPLDWNLLPYMIDRRPVVEGLRRTIRRQKEQASEWPVLGVIHGDEAQCQEKLIERLKEEELRTSWISPIPTSRSRSTPSRGRAGRGTPMTSGTPCSPTWPGRSGSGGWRSRSIGCSTSSFPSR